MTVTIGSGVAQRSVRMRKAWVRGEPRVAVGVRYEDRMALGGVVGARFDRAPTPMWTIPATSMAIAECAQSLRNAGFAVSMDDDVLEVAATMPMAIRDVNDPGGDDPMFASCVLPPRQTQRGLIAAIGQMPGVGVGLGMGGGKTKIVFDAAVAHRLYRVLVACPLSVAETVWARQTDRHVHESIRDRWTTVVLADKPISKRAEALGKALDLHRRRGPGFWLMVVVNHEACWRGALGEMIAATEWDLAAVDESHRIKDAQTKQAEFLIEKVAPRARRRVCCTGTPLGQGPLDAFGQCAFLDQSVFGASFTRFRARYAVMGGKFSPHQVTGYQNVDEFRDRFYRVWSVVPTRDIVELPEVVDEEIVVTLPPEIANAYKSLREELIAEVQAEPFVVDYAKRMDNLSAAIERDPQSQDSRRALAEAQAALESDSRYVVVASNALVKIIRLQQMTSGFAKVERADMPGVETIVDLHGAKRDALIERLDFAGPQEPAVVFCRFTRDIHNIYRAAEASKRPCFQISGQAKEQVQWERDADAGKGPVLAVQIQAGGVGIDLTRARYGWYFSATHSLIDYQQSRCRMDRPGQTRKVRYEHIVVAGTIDRLIYTALQRHENIVSYVLRSAALGRA